MKEGEGALAAIPYPKPTTPKRMPAGLPDGGMFTTPTMELVGRCSSCWGVSRSGVSLVVSGVSQKKPLDATIPLQPTRLTVGAYKYPNEYFFGNHSNNPAPLQRRQCRLRKISPTRMSARTVPTISVRPPAWPPSNPSCTSNVPIRTCQWMARNKECTPLKHKNKKLWPEHANHCGCCTVVQVQEHLQMSTMCSRHEQLI